MTDEIMREVWAVKDAVAKDCRYKIDVLAARLKKQEETTCRQVVDLTGRRRKSVSIKSV